MPADNSTAESVAAFLTAEQFTSIVASKQWVLFATTMYCYALLASRRVHAACPVGCSLQLNGVRFTLHCIPLQVCHFGNNVAAALYMFSTTLLTDIQAMLAGVQRVSLPTLVSSSCCINALAMV
jgi:hypothetical protein